MQKFSIDISPGFCIKWAVLILLLPLRWIAAAVTAALVHECSHYIMLKLLGVSVYGISIGANGAVIHTAPMESFQELICALAGPGGSFLLLALSRWFPLIALCGCIQGIYNLIPLLPFDGGRLLISVLQIWCPSISNQVMNIVKVIACSMIVLGGVLGLRFGILPMMMSLILLGKMLPRKRPCKEGLKRVQCS